ncbi:sensor histidine kinase [Sediminicoccus rosea]|uniref:histidine kinase n=1 Tax=Sediminicoccus rosea TaxID=1225128 RepID=A0ABZ0PQ14_9PROT|nr:ATP-binding protein [Sediminicoccus rosea]WPB87205.1 ATP-binding protein [Sediminicoccus rosea]
MQPLAPVIAASALEARKRIEVNRLCAMLALLLGLLAFLGAAVSTSLAAYRRAEHARLADTARALAGAVDAELGLLEVALRTIATSPRLLPRVPDAGAIRDIGRIGEELGGRIEVLPPGPPGTDPKRRPQALVSDLVEQEGQPLSLAITLPVIREGEVAHLLRFNYPPALLRPMVRHLGLRGESFAAIADGNLRILAHSRDATGRSTGVSAPGWVGPAVAGVQRILVTGPGWQNQPNVYAVERLTAAPGWTVVVAQPVAEIEATAWAALRWLLVGSAAVAIGIALAAWFARRASLIAARQEAAVLREGRAEMARILGALPVVVTVRRVTADGASTLVFREGDITAVTGWPAAGLRGGNDARHLFAPDAPDLPSMLLRTIREGTHRDEVRLRRPDGGWSWVRRGAICLRRDASGGAEVLTYTLNIDRERRAEARAITSSRLASLGEMSTGLAHELLQPLTAILLTAENTQAALDGPAEEAARRALDVIMDQALRASRIIEDLRRFASQPEERPPIKPVTLAEPVGGALALTSGLLRDVEVSVELGREAPVVLCDRTILEHILVTLIGNARDAMAGLPPGVPRRLTIGATRAGGEVRLSVADNGGGIAPEVMERLFEPFVTTKGPDRGIGLGLSVAAGLAERMGAKLQGRNEGAGACFEVTLAAAEVAAEPAR